MLILFAIFVISMAVLIKSADVFTNNVEILGRKFNISPFILGVTVVALGTSLPELASALMAVGYASEIVLGNVMGSNITNILLVLGFSTLFLKKETIISWNPFHGDLTFIIASTIMLGIVLIDGIITLPEAGLLVLGYILYILYTLEINKNTGHKEKNEKIKFNWMHVGLIVGSIILIAVSAHFLINSAVEIAQQLNVGSEIVALTLIALGTSLPELAVSLMAVKKGSIETAIGNITGSNIFNTFIVVGIPRFIGDLTVTTKLFPETYIYLIIAIVLFVSVILDKKIHRFEGAVLFLFYIFFLLALL
jgi:cation:H+ antiporter